MIEEKMEMALTKEIYCYTAKIADKFLSTLFSPLFPTMVANTRLESSISEQKWVSDVFDRPLFLIPYNDPAAEKYALEKETFNLWLTKTPPEDAVRQITFPMMFSLAIEPYFHFKIEGNRLYKNEERLWKPVELN